MALLEANDATYNLMRQVWKSGKHVGANKPKCRAYIRTVKIQRTYRVTNPDHIYATIPAFSGGKIWRGKLIVKDDYVRVPNLLDVTVDQDYDQQGVAQATLNIDNVAMTQMSGVAGIYHVIDRGYYAPFRGYDPPSDQRLPVGEENDWYDKLRDKSSQITIVAGYGTKMIPIFTGLINDLDLTSSPDVITVRCRDFGQLLTDQQTFINAKPRNVQDPITFADRRSQDNTEDVGSGAEASSEAGGHLAKYVIAPGENHWISGANAHQSAVEYIELKLPAGRYDSFAMTPEFPGMKAWVAIKAKDKNAPGGKGARTVSGIKFADGAWVDGGFGQVPGTDVKFVKEIDRVKGKKTYYDLPDTGYVLGDDSVLRIYLSNLDYGFHGTPQRDYRAGLVFLQAQKRDLDDKEKKKWILVDDLSDVVKTVLQWCGFDEWEIESTGVRLKHKSVWNRGNYLMEIITAAADQVGYVFHIKPPEIFDEDDLSKENETNLSIGVPVFRQNQGLRKGQGVIDRIVQVKEDTVLTGINAKFSDEPLAYNIRVRGKEIPTKDGGRPLGGDETARWMYVYRPPWSREGAYRNGNIKKYVVHHDPKLRSLDECKIAALFIAYREALEAAQVQIQFPAMPFIHLDHQTALYDTGTGLSTRMWVAMKTVKWSGGENPEFTMSLGGALLDIPDTVAVRDELVQALSHAGYNPGLSEWERNHFGEIYRNN